MNNLNNLSFQVKVMGGGNLDLTPNIFKTFQTLNNTSAVGRLAPALTGTEKLQLLANSRILKDTKRRYEGNDLQPNTGAFPALSSFTKSSPTLYAEKVSQTVVRSDDIVINSYDTLTIDQQFSVLQANTVKFMLAQSELDLHELLTWLYNDAKVAKIFTSVDASKNYMPTGAQPVATAITTNAAIAEILNGLRITKPLTDLSLLDSATGDSNAMKLIRATIGYLQLLGSPNSIESLYLFSINGIPLDNIVIACSYVDVLHLKGGFTTAFIDLNDPHKLRTYNGIVGMIDTIPVIITNQLPTLDGADAIKCGYYVGSDRAISRNIIARQYIGTLNPYATVTVDKDGNTVKLSPADALMQFESPRKLLVPFEHEAFFILKA